MSLPIVFRSAAQTEFDDAAFWYENQQEDLGADFVGEVQKVLGTIAQHPKRFAIVEADVREAIISRFPYSVYYRIRSQRIVIIAVFHCSRDPAVWRARI